MDPSYTYFKIPIAEQGIYHIDYKQLVTSGFPVSDIDPRNIKLFHRGQEVAIRIEGQSDAHFDQTDFIEFFGEANDGDLDNYLYRISDLQPHKYYNLFSDTTSYFLTWGYGLDRGKRITSYNEKNVTSIPAEEYLLLRNRKLITNDYSRGYSIQGSFTSSRFEQGEGFTGSRISQGKNIDYITWAGRIIDNIRSGKVKVFIVGRNYEYHDAEIWVGRSASQLRLAGSVSIFGYQSKEITFEISGDDIDQDGNVSVRIINLLNGKPNQISLSYIETQIPVSSNLGINSINKVIIEDNTSSKSFIELSGLSAGQEFFDITDPVNPVRILLNYNLSKYSGIIRTKSETTLFINSTKLKPARISRIEKINWQILDNTFLIISHEKLMRPGIQTANPVKAYADYRSSSAGGSFNSFVVDIDQLYNEFSYGEKTPLAIFRFIDQLKSLNKIRYILLIGKGLDTSINPERNRNISIQFEDLIPSSGSPGSDIIFASGINSSSAIPIIPIGRISASEPADVENYLEKIKLHESIRIAQPWRKNVLHLSGGATESELTDFRNYLDEFGLISERSLIGADVTTFQKTSTKESEFINISEAINNGVGLVTFFGHSASNILDIDVGFVTNQALDYHNYGKYPVFLMNGCNIGSIFFNSKIQSEDWILAANKGALAVLALSNLGTPDYLKKYSEIFYQLIFRDQNFLNKGIGDIQKETIIRDELELGTSLFNESHLEQMVLLGDPAAKIFPFAKPDFTPKENSVVLNPGAPINTNSDLTVNLIVENNGVLIEDSVSLIVKRTLPDNTIEYYGPFFYNHLKSYNPLTLLLPNRETRFGGSNQLELIIDPDNEVQEINELNNWTKINFEVQTDIPDNIFPYHFALLPETKLKFTGISQRPAVRIEIDDNPYFTSKQTINTITELGSFADYADLQMYPVKTFFWKTTANNIDYSDQSSFTIAMGNDSTGWSQRTRDQFQKDELKGLRFDIQQNTYVWETKEINLAVHTFGSTYNASVADVILEIDGVPYIYASRLCSNNSLNVVAFDHNSLVPYAPDPHNTIMCGRTPQVINSFTDVKLINYPDLFVGAIDGVKDRDYILFFSIGKLSYSTWSGAIKSKLEDLGLDIVTFQQMPDGGAFIFLSQKSNLPISQAYSPGNQPLDLSVNIQNEGSGGEIISPWIGPAQSWGSFSFKVSGTLNSNYQFDILAKDHNQNVIKYMTGLSALSSISDLDANMYPYIQLVFRTSGLVPVSLDQWTILFEPEAKGILKYIGNNFNSNPVFEVNEGDSVQSEFMVKNLSSSAFSFPLIMKFNQVAFQSGKEFMDSLAIEGPGPWEAKYFTITSPTIDLVGLNSLKISIANENSGFQNPSQYSQMLDPYFNVVHDNLNPVLDVVVDGKHILPGEAVSEEPEITITYWDANEYLLRQGVDAFQVEFGRLCDTCRVKVYNGFSENILFTPGPDPRTLIIKFKPGKLAEGSYILQVNVKDASGNYSGTLPYKIEFSIASDNNIEIYPMPNPFKDRLFIYANIKSKTVPGEFLMKIWNDRGQLICEVSLSELATLKPGINRIEIPWEISSPSGIYLYKVLTRPAEKWEYTHGDHGIIIFSK